MKLSNAPIEITRAINAGYCYDDSGVDVRETGELSAYDHNGNPDDPAAIYRLWNSRDGSAPTDRGYRFEVHEDGTIESDCISPIDGALL